MAYYSRSSWTSSAKSAVALAGTGRTQTEIYIHYPGQAAAIGKASVESQKARLRGYLRLHKVARGWADIAYNVAVDQRGNVYELRGIDRQCGANGGTASNRRGQAILVLVGNNEAPTAECIAGIKDAVSRIRKVHPTAKRIRGHQQSPDASTACPGSHLMRLVRSGALEPGAVTKVPSGGASAPAPPKPAKPSKPGKIDEDGRFGRDTVRALQRWLNREHGAKLDVDGKAGHSTWRALQRALGAPYADGKISRQSHSAKSLGNGITQGWEHTGPNSKGSQTVKLLQRLIGVNDDGIWGEKTTRALQKFLNKRGAGA